MPGCFPMYVFSQTPEFIGCDRLYESFNCMCQNVCNLCSISIDIMDIFLCDLGDEYINLCIYIFTTCKKHIYETSIHAITLCVVRN